MLGAQVTVRIFMGCTLAIRRMVGARCRDDGTQSVAPVRSGELPSSAPPPTNLPKRGLGAAGALTESDWAVVRHDQRIQRRPHGVGSWALDRAPLQSLRGDLEWLCSLERREP